MTKWSRAGCFEQSKYPRGTPGTFGCSYWWSEGKNFGKHQIFWSWPENKNMPPVDRSRSEHSSTSHEWRKQIGVLKQTIRFCLACYNKSWEFGHDRNTCQCFWEQTTDLRSWVDGKQNLALYVTQLLLSRKVDWAYSFAFSWCKFYSSKCYIHSGCGL